MTLYDFLQKNKHKDITVFDNAYDTESYWNYCTMNERKKDSWDNSLMELAKKLNVVVVENQDDYSASVTCDISDLIERNMKNIAGTDLFIKNNIDAIMWDFDNIIGGYVSESWFDKFVGILQ